MPPINTIQKSRRTGSVKSGARSQQRAQDRASSDKSFNALQVTGHSHHNSANTVLWTIQCLIMLSGTWYTPSPTRNKP